MRGILKFTGALLLGGAVGFSAGCGGKKSEAQGVWPDGHGKNEIRIPQPEQSAPAPAPTPTPAPTPAPTPVVDAATGGYTEGNEGTAVRPPVKSVPELPPVYFDFDKAELSDSGKKALEQHALYIKANPEIHVVLRGHTDESGTEEYNIALGSRRAQAVRDHLIAAGISGNRLETISFGEGLPIAEGSTEQAHQQNRRVEFFLYVPE